MKLQQTYCGSNWFTDDPAMIYLSHTGHGPAPETVDAFRIGSHGLERTATMPVPLAELQYLARAEFGPARGGTGTRAKWTGSYLRFGIYRWMESFGDRIVILRADGSGSKAYVVEDLDAVATWTDLIALLPEPRLWDVCSSLVHTYHEGRKTAQREAYQHFADGRLKRRRRAGRVYVELIPESEATKS